MMTASEYIAHLVATEPIMAVADEIMLVLRLVGANIEVLRMNDIEAPWIGDPDYGHDDKMDYDEWYRLYGADTSEDDDNEAEVLEWNI